MERCLTKAAWTKPTPVGADHLGRELVPRDALTRTFGGPGSNCTEGNVIECQQLLDGRGGLVIMIVGCKDQRRHMLEADRREHTGGLCDANQPCIAGEKTEQAFTSKRELRIW